MKIIEIIEENTVKLNETAQDDLDMAQMSQAIMFKLNSGKVGKFQKYLDRVSTGTITLDDVKKGLKLGVLGKFINLANPNNNSIKELLDTVKLIVLPRLPDHSGEYRSTTKTKEIVIVINKNWLQNQETIKSTLIHELRHALDDIKSNKKYYRRHGRGPYSAYRGPDQNDVPWENRPGEWGAVYTQITQALYAHLLKLKSRTPKTYLEIDNRYIKRMVVEFLNNFHGLGNPFEYGAADPNYRRMFKRLYNFSISALQILDHLAGGTPPAPVPAAEPDAAPMTQNTKRYEKKFPQEAFNLLNQNRMNIYTQEDAKAAGVQMICVVKDDKAIQLFFERIKIRGIDITPEEQSSLHALEKIATKLQRKAVFYGNFGDGKSVITSSGQKVWIPNVLLYEILKISEFPTQRRNQR